MQAHLAATPAAPSMDTSTQRCADAGQAVPQTIASAILYAVESDRPDRLRELLFEPQPWFDGERHRWVLRPGMACVLMDGFAAYTGPDMAAPVSSFADICFFYGRLQMLRDALECARPATVHGRAAEADWQWLLVLSSARMDGEHSTTSLLHTATFPKIHPHSYDFVLLAIEYGRGELAAQSSIDSMRTWNPAGAGLISQCAMALHLQRTMLETMSTPRAWPATADPVARESAAAGRRTRRL